MSNQARKAIYLLRRIAGRLRGRPSVRALRASGVDVGRRVRLRRGVHIDGINASAIRIGDDALLEERVVVLAHDASMKRLTGWTRVGDRPTVIGRGAVIGARTVVLGGVTIGDGAVVEPDSVVARDVPGGARVGGKPAVDLGHTSLGRRPAVGLQGSAGWPMKNA